MQKGKDYWLQAQQGHRAWHKECYMKADKLVDDKIAVMRIECVDWIRWTMEAKLGPEARAISVIKVRSEANAKWWYHETEEERSYTLTWCN